MKAMILAAGRGERMKPLTDTIPKPLLPVNGKPLIDYTIENLVKAGFTEIVINIAHLGEQIQGYCGDGRHWGAAIAYSDEGTDPLETAGGIAKALPLLGEAPFLAINADLICDFPLAVLRRKPVDLAHLVLVGNPAHHPRGDFNLAANGLLTEQGPNTLTFSGIGIYRPALFADLPSGPQKLRPLFETAIRRQRVSGEKYGGLWQDIGTPERLSDAAVILAGDAR